MELIEKLKKRFNTKKPLREGRIYDLRHKCWGHNIEFRGKGKLKNSHRICGWLTPRVSNGDLFLHPATKGLAVFQLFHVENCDDPADMFFADTGIVRYATSNDLKKVKQDDLKKVKQSVKLVSKTKKKAKKNT
jgi:hypothetical protein